MSDWFQDLSGIRRSLVESLRANKTKIVGSVVDKYPDPTHFIFELLQNAEDQSAREVEFVIESDRLSFLHDGAPFRHEDVEAITNIGDSRKLEQENKIGRFGVGFKSVFRVTERPVIRCELEGRPFCFAIEDLLVPILLRPDDVDAEPGRTVFVLPYKPGFCENDRRAICETLSGLGASALLFLDRIKRVRWRCGDLSGEITCDRSDPAIRTLTRQVDGSAVVGSVQYLVFRREVRLEESDRPAQVVMLAFRLDERGQVVAEDVPTSLHVFFETRETSGLFFRLHGPFLLTDNRANIKERESVNARLFKECDELLVGAIRGMKSQGRLKASLLAVLPNGDDNLASWCKPLRDSLFEAMRREPLVPMARGGHGPAKLLSFALPAIRSVISDEDLAYLKDGEVLGWATGAAAISRQEKFLTSLGIERWGWKNLLRCLEERFDETDDSDESQAWLARHDDDWFQSFYALLDLATEKTKNVHLEIYPRGWPLVRTQDGRYLKGDQVFFPPRTGAVGLVGISFVKAEILGEDDNDRSGKAKAYLTTVGVREVGKREEILAVLNEYYSPAKSRSLSEYCLWPMTFE